MSSKRKKTKVLNQDVQGRRRKRLKTSSNTALPEDVIERDLLEDEVIKPKKNEEPKRTAEVGVDERDYMTDELKKQGYTNEGLIDSSQKARGNPNPQRGQKIA